MTIDDLLSLDARVSGSCIIDAMTDATFFAQRSLQGGESSSRSLRG